MKNSSKNKSVNKIVNNKNSKPVNRNLAGLIIGGCTLLGLGLAFIFDQVPAGIFIGIGVGLLIVAFLHYKRN